MQIFKYIDTLMPFSVTLRQRNGFVLLIANLITKKLVKTPTQLSNNDVSFKF